MELLNLLLYGQQKQLELALSLFAIMASEGSAMVRALIEMGTESMREMEMNGVDIEMDLTGFHEGWAFTPTASLMATRYRLSRLC